jgi:dGTPase
MIRPAILVNHGRARPPGVGSGMVWAVKRAPYASNPEQSRGRLHPEPEHDMRSPFQRDRDRIIHSTAFRRLKHKTQVFVYHEGDHFRTRLTHSLEVAQIARTIARALGLEEDLAEAVGLAHDLGHTPFGHAGEEALNVEMQPFGGFSHNDQTLRILTRLEHGYAEFDGLNLTWETLEGTAKHNGPLVGPGIEAPVPPSIAEYDRRHTLELETFAGPEAQIAALADDIAYNNHDVDDGYRASFFTFADLAQVPIAARAIDEVHAAHPGIDGTRLLYESLRRLMTAMINDVTAETRRRLAALSPQSIEDVRHAQEPVVAFSPAMQRELDLLRAFLTTRVYRAPRIDRIMSDAERVVAELFARYSEDEAALPPEWREQAPEPGTRSYARHIADFIAGMTDRYALAEHRRLFDATPDLR